jgi:hypothetical protein
MGFLRFLALEKRGRGEFSNILTRASPVAIKNTAMNVVKLRSKPAGPAGIVVLQQNFPKSSETDQIFDGYYCEAVQQQSRFRRDASKAVKTAQTGRYA